MGRVYSGQSELRIRLDTSQNISGATAQVKYKKPSGKTGVVAAVIENATTGIIYHDVTATGNLIDEVGKWKFWAYITFTGNRVAPGKAAVVNVYEEGD